MTEPAEFLVMALGDGNHRVRLDRLADGRIMCQLCFAHFAIADLNPVDGGVEDVCKPCARIEYLRGVDAHITHGVKYHTDAKCPLMLGGEYLHDWEGDIDYGGGFTAGSYRIVTNVHDAAMRGKLPCLGCISAELRVFPPLYGQTFGHEPVWADFGQCVIDVGACNCPYHDEQQACARCRRGHQPVPWPCTSAIVLGLAPRRKAAA